MLFLISLSIKIAKGHKGLCTWQVDNVWVYLGVHLICKVECLQRTGKDVAQLALHSTGILELDVVLKLTFFDVLIRIDEGPPIIRRVLRIVTIADGCFITASWSRRKTVLTILGPLYGLIRNGKG